MGDEGRATARGLSTRCVCPLFIRVLIHLDRAQRRRPSGSLGPDVSVMKTSDPRQTSDLGSIRGAMPYSAAFRGIADRGMNALRVEVLDVLPEESSQMVVVEDDHVIEQLSPDASDETLSRSVLPRTSERCAPGADPEGWNGANELMREDRVVVEDQVSMARCVREGISQLLHHPIGSWVRCHVEVEDATSPVIDGKPGVEEPEANSRHDEEVHPGDHVPVIPEESRPPLSRVFGRANLGQVPGDRGLTEMDSQLGQLCLDLASAPMVLGGHSHDERSGLLRDRRPAGAGLRDPAPIASEGRSVPANHRLRPDQDECVSPFRPDARKSDPEGSVQWREPGPGVLVDVDGELLAEARQWPGFHGFGTTHGYCVGWKRGGWPAPGP
jgi:hypothetical protein